MSKTAILSVRVISDTKKARKGLEDTRTSFEKFQSGLNKASVVAGVVLAGMVKLGKGLIDAGEAANTANSGVAKVIENYGEFGDKAGVVSDRLIKVAENMARATGIDPNDIKAAQATLGTFDQIANSADVAGGTMDRATQAAMDLAAAGFGNLTTNSRRLGRALQDPAGQMGSLSRLGIDLTDAQQKQIEAFQEVGDVAAAQNVILEAAEKSVGGLAEATADASDQQKVAWQLAREELGLKLLPLFEKATEYGIKAADVVAEHADLILKVAAVIGGMAAAIIGLNAAIKIAQALQVAWTVAVKAAKVAQLAFNLVMKANPILLIITLVIAAIVLLIVHWDKVKEVALIVWDAIKDAALWLWDNVLVPIGEWLADTFGRAWESLTEKATATWDAITAGAQWLWDNVLVPIGEWIYDNFTKRWETLKAVATLVWNLIKLGAMQLWNNVLKPVADWIASNFIDRWNRLKSTAQIAWNLIKIGASTLWNTIKQVASYVGGTFSSVWNTVRNAGSNAINAIIWPVQTLIGWLQRAWQWATQLFSKASSLGGRLFGFSAAAPVVTTAAPGAPSLPSGIGQPPRAQQNINFEINLPNYMGEKDEIIEWIEKALRNKARTDNGLVIA